MILALALIVLAQHDGGAADEPLDVVSHASPKATVDAEAATDFLAASNTNNDEGTGATPELTAFELGLRARVYATAVSRHLHVDFDYQGRQPVAGSAQNSAIHLLLKAEVSADFLDKKIFVGLGRFLPPSALMLPVDGLRARLHVWNLDVQVFGGRRAITSTRTGNVELSTFLPAVGGSATLTLSQLQAEVAVTYSQDQVVPIDRAEPQKFDSLSAYARATARPTDWLVLGAQVATAQRATYLLGPSWSDLSLRATSLDLFYVTGFVDVRPLRTLRIAYDFQYQQAQLFRDPELFSDVFTPRFIDNRLRVRWRPFELGWLGPEARLRVRPEWNEWRVGGFIDLAPTWAYGFCLRGTVLYDKLVSNTAALAPPDRSYWALSLGFRRGGLDLQAGASNVQRSALPLSSRVYTPYDDTPTRPADLAPFVLEAQRIAFVRAFYGNDVWFAGVDFEQSLTDGRERRLFAQVGARLEKEWF